MRDRPLDTLAWLLAFLVAAEAFVGARALPSCPAPRDSAPQPARGVVMIRVSRPST